MIYKTINSGNDANKTIFKAISIGLFAFVLAFVALMPATAKADFNPLNPLDPFCWFSCGGDSDNSSVTYNNSNNVIDSNNTTNNVTNNTTNQTNSNNTNSNNTVYANTNTNTNQNGIPSGNTNTNTNVNNNTVYQQPTVAVVTPTVVTQPIYYNTPTYQTPVYQTPVYVEPHYSTYYPQTYYATPTYYPTYSSLSVSCYANATSVNSGDIVIWRATAYGGNGSYNYSWSGTDSLYGYSSVISKSYGYSGIKYGIVTVTSGNQTTSVNCSSGVVVNNYNYNYPYTYANPVYNSPIAVSCRANATFAPVGTSVTWTAYASGGNAYYTYSWSGTESAYGVGSSISQYYNNPGTKYETVTVYSGNQQATAQCSNILTVGVQNQYVYNSGIQNGLQLSCSADRTSTTVGTPINWEVQTAGNGAIYNYAWTGTDGLSGSQSSVVTSYATPGKKSAVVMVTTASGQSQSKACSNVVTVKSNTVAAVAKAAPATPAVVVTQAPPVQQPIYAPAPNTDQSAASLFSLKNIPWGWVAILVILVLFGTVFYLIFNRKQI